MKSVIVSLTLCVLFGIGDGQNSVQIQVTSPIRLRQDDLRITCSATGSYDAITTYVISKNDSNGIVSQVVQQIYSLTSNSVTTTWTDMNLRSRATLTGVDLPSAQATMIMTVPKDQVACPGDAVSYQCEFSAIVTAGGSSPQTKSNMQNVEITTVPSGTQPIIVQAEFNGQQVPTMTNGRHVFAVGTMLTLSCTAEVGSNMQTQHWCHKREQDFSWDSPPSGVSNGEVIQTGCQYSRISTYVHNVTANDNTRMILCEIGGNTQCGFGDFNSNLTIYLSSTGESSGQTNNDGDGGDAGIIAGAVIGSIAGLVVIILIVYFVIFRNRQGGSSQNKTKEDQPGRNGQPEGPVYSIPHKDQNKRSDHRDRANRYAVDNRGLDEPHEEKPYRSDGRGHYNPNLSGDEDGDIKRTRSIDDMAQGSQV